MATKIQIRRDTASNWSTNNPILSSGEIAFVTDENKIKIGDGATAWNSLAYLEADAYLDSVVMGDDTTGNYVETLIASDGISISGEGSESASVTVTNTGVLSLAGTTNEIEVSASSGNITLSLPTSITVDLVGDVTGNADTASALATARNISLGGDVSGSASFDGSADITITATVADDSHNHTISNVDGLQDALDEKAPIDSPALTGTPTAPTASSATNSTQIATTAFVQTAVGNLIDGAPGALDTLNELAASLGDDSDFAGTVTNSLAGKQPLDSDLTAIAELSASATGYAKKTGDGTWSVGDIALGTETTGNYVASISGTANEIEVSGSGSESAAVTLSLPDTINANTTGSAATLTTARAISLSGDVSGSASFDGSANISITATVADDSHNHIIGNVDGLQTALDGKQPIDADLTAIAALAGTSGFLKKTGEDTWSLDTNTYLTGNQTITVSGDAAGSGTTSISLTLADSGVSASTYGGSTSVPVITVDSKGRLTSVSTAAIGSLPSQTGNSGKYLTTDGTNASWSDVSSLNMDGGSPSSTYVAAAIINAGGVS
jgi:hypothetical protein